MKNKKISGILLAILLVVSTFPIASATDSDINKYSREVADFIEEKCHDDCEKIVILGEDSIVPHYRREISMFSGMWWWKDLEPETVLTDQLYTQTGDIYFSDLDKLFKKKLDVKFIISSSLKDDMHGKVEELKSKLESKYSTNVATIDEKNVACNSFSQLDDATLIIIGNESNNNAIKCMPFLPEETSYIAIERNVWDNKEYAIVLNPTEDIYDNLLALNYIVDNGVQADWTFKDTVVACLWDGKFGGSVPTTKEIACNLIPLVELAPDIRDSWRCIFANKDTDTDSGVVNAFVCTIVHICSGYDIATWGAAIVTAGATGAGGEVFDVGLATFKIFFKKTLPAIVSKLGRKIVKEAFETLLAAPKLIKGSIQLVIKSPKLITQLIEGSIQILKHGPEVAEAAFKEAKGWNFELSDDALSGLGNIKELGIKKKYAIFIENNKFTKAGYEFFGDDTIYKRIIAARKGLETEFQQVRIYVAKFEGQKTNAFGVFIEESNKIILNARKLSNPDDLKYVRDFVLYHEHGHALRNIVTEGKLIPRLKRLFGGDPSVTKETLTQFIEFDDTWRMYNFLDNAEAAVYKNALKNHNYGATFANKANNLAAGGYKNKEQLARYLAETEKFGFTDQYQLLVDAIDYKIGANSALKKYILELKEVMVKNAGHVTPSSYDTALKKVYTKMNA